MLREVAPGPGRPRILFAEKGEWPTTKLPDPQRERLAEGGASRQTPMHTDPHKGGIFP